jgi:hypothetical protein
MGVAFEHRSAGALALVFQSELDQSAGCPGALQHWE